MKIYLTSDTHFGHDKLSEVHGRPEDFGERLLASIKSRQGDLLIHCGDFCIGEDDRHVKAYMAAAKGFQKKILIRGNHDKKSDYWYMARGFTFVTEAMLSEFFGQMLLFTHMPVKRDDGYWSPHFPPTFNIHGHLHGDAHRKLAMDESLYDRAYHYDLAPEIHDYKIVDLESLFNR